MGKLSKEILEKGSFACLNSLFTEESGVVLEDFQTVAVMLLLHNKKGIVVYDTGMGKTYVAGGFIKALQNMDKQSKFLFIGLNDQLEQTPDKLRKITGLKVAAFSAEATDVRSFELMDLTGINILFLTRECLSNETVMLKLYNELDLFKAVILDEAHSISNFYGSISGELLRSVVNRFEYKVALSATPITTKTLQLTQLAHIIDRDFIENPWETARLLDGGYPLVADNPDFFILKRRSDIGADTYYVPKLLLVKPMSHQKGAEGYDLFQTVKGDGAVRQAKALENIICAHMGKNEKGLVYIRHHAVREWVVARFKETDIRFACINGKQDTVGPNKKPVSREAIYELFSKGLLDVVITSITHCVDLDCDYIFFYEFYTDVKQMLGRGHRGLVPKQLTVYFMFTLDTGEIDFFLRNIYERSVLIQNVLNQISPELFKIAKEARKAQREVEKMRLCQEHK